MGNLQGLTSKNRGKFEPKTPLLSPYHPTMFAKIKCQFLSTGQLNLWAKYLESKKTDLNNFLLGDTAGVEVGIRVQPNFPIVIPSLMALKMPEINAAKQQ